MGEKKGASTPILFSLFPFPFFFLLMVVFTFPLMFQLVFLGFRCSQIHVYMNLS